MAKPRLSLSASAACSVCGPVLVPHGLRAINPKGHSQVLWRTRGQGQPPESALLSQPSAGRPQLFPMPPSSTVHTQCYTQRCFHRLLLSCGQTTRVTRGRKEAQVNVHSRFLKDITLKFQAFTMRTGWPGRSHCLFSFPSAIRRFPAINFLFLFLFFFWAQPPSLLTDCSRNVPSLCGDFFNAYGNTKRSHNMYRSHQRKPPAQNIVCQVQTVPCIPFSTKTFLRSWPWTVSQDVSMHKRGEWSPDRNLSSLPLNSAYKSHFSKTPKKTQVSFIPKCISLSLFKMKMEAGLLRLLIFAWNEKSFATFTSQRKEQVWKWLTIKSYKIVFAI